MRARVISFMQQNKACLNGMENYPFLFWLFLSYSFSFSYEFFLSLLVSQFISYSTKIQSPYSISSKKEKKSLKAVIHIKLFVCYQNNLNESLTLSFQAKIALLPKQTSFSPRLCLMGICQRKKKKHQQTDKVSFTITQTSTKGKRKDRKAVKDDKLSFPRFKLNFSIYGLIAYLYCQKRQSLAVCPFSVVISSIFV